MFKAVVFDMDGVIFDSEKIYRILEHEQIRKYGLDESKADYFCEIIAGGTKETNRRHFEEVFHSDVDYYEFREGVMSGVDDYAEKHGYELKPGVVELLKHLKEKGIKVALATSTTRERGYKHLKRHGLYEYFDEFVFGDMIKNGKPNPDIYLKACELLDVKPEEAIGIEDSINGVISSHAAGLYTIMVIDLIQPNDDIKEKAEKIYDSLFQVIDLIG